jgi:hypothetical protein
VGEEPERHAEPRGTGILENIVSADDARSQRVAPVAWSASSFIDPERSNITNMFTGTNMACITSAAQAASVVGGPASVPPLGGVMIGPVPPLPVVPPPLPP